MSLDCLPNVSLVQRKCFLKSELLLIKKLIITASDTRPRQQSVSIWGGCVVLMVPLGFGMAECDVF